MATTSSNTIKKTISKNKNNYEELKHLGFIEIYVLESLLYLLQVYDRSKQNSGSLKSGIQTMEGIASKVLHPVYQKFKGYPYDLLFFLDNKVDRAENKFDAHASPRVKQLVSQAWYMTRRALQLKLAFITDIRAKGLLVAAKQLVLALVAGIQAKTEPVAGESAMDKPTYSEVSSLHSENEIAAATTSTPRLSNNLNKTQKETAESHHLSNTLERGISLESKNSYCTCFCGIPAMVTIVWTNENAGRRFAGCKNYHHNSCGFFHWMDPPISARDRIQEYCAKNERLDLLNDGPKLKIEGLSQKNYDLKKMLETEEAKSNEMEANNEQLELLNDQLRGKIHELSQKNDDFKKKLESEEAKNNDFRNEIEETKEIYLEDFRNEIKEIENVYQKERRMKNLAFILLVVVSIFTLYKLLDIFLEHY